MKISRGGRFRLVVVAVALSAVALTVGLTVPSGSSDPSRASDSENLAGKAAAKAARAVDATKVQSAGSFDDWAPPVKDGSGLTKYGPPAKAGTLLYRTCASGDCEIRLVRPDGVTFDLADLRPDVARKLAKAGLDGATLSFDGRWLGIRDGRAYDIHNLESKLSERLRPGPEGSRWEPIGWDTGSFAVTLAQYQGDKVVRYARFDTLGPDGVRTYDVRTATARKLPVEHGGDRIEIAQPIDTAVPPSQRVRVTSVQSDHFVLEDGSTEPGEPTVLARQMQDGETLAGPRGVPEEFCQPDPGNEKDSICARKVFTVQGDEVVPKAVMFLVSTDGREPRVELPRSKPGDTWSWLGPLGGGIGLAHATSANGIDVVQRDLKSTRVLHRLPGDASVLLPGAILGS